MITLEIRDCQECPFVERQGYSGYVCTKGLMVIDEDTINHCPLKKRQSSNEDLQYEIDKLKRQNIDLEKRLNAVERLELIYKQMARDVSELIDDKSRLLKMLGIDEETLRFISPTKKKKSNDLPPPVKEAFVRCD